MKKRNSINANPTPKPDINFQNFSYNLNHVNGYNFPNVSFMLTKFTLNIYLLPFFYFYFKCVDTF